MEKMDWLIDYDILYQYSTAHAENASSASHRGQISTRTVILVHEDFIYHRGRNKIAPVGVNKTDNRGFAVEPSRIRGDIPLTR